MFLTVAFAFAFVVLGALAWSTAAGTLGPWFPPAVSMQMYSVSLIAANLLAVLLSAASSRRIATLEEALRALDLRIAAAKDAAADRTSVPTGSSGGPAPEEDEIDELLQAIGGFESVVRVERVGHDSLLASPEPAAIPAKAGLHVLREIRSQRQRLRAARDLVWRLAIGPVLVSVVFILISGAMLPAAEGFAETNFRLNTALILFLGYGWAPLVAWSVAATLLMNSGSSRETE